MGMISAITGDQQQVANAKAQEQQAQYNQKLAERDAEAIDRTTQVNALRQMRQSRQLRSMQRAQLGKSGVAIDSGSPLALAAHTAAQEQLKATDVQHEGYVQAAKRRQEAQMHAYQARVARMNRPSGLDLALGLGKGMLQDVRDVVDVGKAVVSIGSLF